MKHLIYAALIILVSACSESEDPKFCFDCTVFTITTSPSGYYNEETETVEHCGKTDAEANAIENEGTSERNEGANTIIMTTTCTKQG